MVRPFCLVYHFDRHGHTKTRPKPKRKSSTDPFGAAMTGLVLERARPCGARSARSHLRQAHLHDHARRCCGRWCCVCAPRARDGPRSAPGAHSPPRRPTNGLPGACHANGRGSWGSQLRVVQTGPVARARTCVSRKRRLARVRCSVHPLRWSLHDHSRGFVRRKLPGGRSYRTKWSANDHKHRYRRIPDARSRPQAPRMAM